MSKAAEEAQNVAMEYLPSGDKSTYEGQNKKMSNLINLRNLTEGGLGESSSVPMRQGSVGLISNAIEGANRYVTPTVQELGSSILNKASNLASGSPYISSLINALRNPAINSQINNFKIPMNTEKILKNTNLVYAKIMQEFGQEAAIAFRDAKSKQQIMGMVRIFQKQKPLIFERSKYNNFDGIIDPPFKQQAVEDIMKDKNLPAHVNAEKMQKLLHDGLVD
jgi:hypothetical protein